MFRENRDKIETYLAFGASRFEACKPIAIEGLRLALLPTINQMSVIGELACERMFCFCSYTLTDGSNCFILLILPLRTYCLLPRYLYGTTVIPFDSNYWQA